jgi:hypothetical protein
MVIQLTAQEQRFNKLQGCNFADPNHSGVQPYYLGIPRNKWHMHSTSISREKTCGEN